MQKKSAEMMFHVTYSKVTDFAKITWTKYEDGMQK